MPQRATQQSSRSNLVKIAYDNIKEAIISNKLKPGPCISGSQLAQLFQMSRTPIREAIHLLENEGLVEMRNGAGFYVKAVTLEDLWEINQVRCSLECTAAALSIDQVPQGELRDGIVQWRTLKDALSENSAPHDQVVALDQETHYVVTRHCGNSYLIGLLDEIETKVRQTQYLSLNQENIVVTIDQHISILEGMLQKNTPQVQQLLKQHFQDAMDYVKRYSKDFDAEYGGQDYLEAIFKN